MLPVQYIMLGWLFGWVGGWFVFRNDEKRFAKMLMVIGVQTIVFFGSYLVGGG
jgi:predicted permease